MDILFPWRKSVQPNGNDGMNHGHGGSFGESGNSNGQYHSLPHPQEHAQHYGGAPTPQGQGPTPRQMMMQSFKSGASGGGWGQSQRSFATGVSNGGDGGGGGWDQSQRSFGTGVSNGGPSFRGGGGGDGGRQFQESDTTEMMPNRQFQGSVMTQDMMGEEGDFVGEDGRQGMPQFRAPLDQSNRSQTSDLPDKTGGRPRDPQDNGMYYQEEGYEQDLIPVEEIPLGENIEGAPMNMMMNDVGAPPPSTYQSQPSRRSLLTGSFMRGQESSRSFGQQSSRSFGQQSSRSFGQQSSRSFGQQSYMTEDEMGYQEEENLPVSPLRQLLDAINMSILPTSLRLSSLAQAVEFFDHRDRAMHDAELREGGAFVLYHKLGLVLRLSKCGEAALSEGEGAKGNTSDRPKNHYMSYQQSLASSIALQQQSEFDKEIAMICSCLEMVHRANPDAIAQTWDECGTEILPLLVTVLERPFQKIERAVWMAMQEKANVPGSLERAVAMAVTRDQKLAVQKVTKVLAMYSLVPEAKKPMCDSQGMLRWLTRIVDTHNYNRVKPGAPVIGGSATPGATGGSLSGMDNDDSSDAKAKQSKRMELANRATSGAGLYMTEAARFNTIATLTNLAAHEANRMPMLREPGLLDNICRAVHNERSDVPKQCSALAIMNLSNGDMDHVPEMARNDLVLETLLKLMKEDNPETRRNAVVTIFNVACSDQNTVRLARYRDGTILEALVELVGSDDPVLRTHDEARANAAETVFNMSCSEISETTDRMANHAGLLECLAVTLRGEHTGLEVKMYCSATLRRMAELIRHPMIAQGALLSALVKAATWTNTDCIAEAFRAQASVPENCVIMAHHHGLLNALSRLALTRGEGQDVEKVRMASCLAIELMSRQDEARALLSQNEGIIMALTKASYGEEHEEQEREPNLMMSNMSALSGGFMDASGHDSGRELGNDGEDDDDMSLQSRRIQVALKNLVAAM